MRAARVSADRPLLLYGTLRRPRRFHHSLVTAITQPVSALRSKHRIAQLLQPWRTSAAITRLRGTRRSNKDQRIPSTPLWKVPGEHVEANIFENECRSCLTGRYSQNDRRRGLDCGFPCYAASFLYTAGGELYSVRATQIQPNQGRRRQHLNLPCAIRLVGIYNMGSYCTPLAAAPRLSYAEPHGNRGNARGRCTLRNPEVSSAVATRISGRMFRHCLLPSAPTCISLP